MRLIMVLIAITIGSSIYSLATNPDGTIEIIPYEKTQEKELKELIVEIDSSHKQFIALLPYLKLRNKATNDRYFLQYSQELTWEPRNPVRYFEVESIDIKLSGNIIQTVVFAIEKNRLGKRAPNTRETKQLINTSPVSSTADGLALKVIESGEGPDITRIYNVNSIRDPKERLKIVRSYRNYIFETIQRIERMQMVEIKNGDIEIKNTLRSLK